MKLAQKELFEKEFALDHVEAKNQAKVNLARDFAVSIARSKGTVSIEDVREFLPHIQFGNWAGAIFRRGFAPCGSLLTRHKGSHARRVLVWKLI